MPSITREHRGIVIDGYALVLFQDEVVLGADVQRPVDIPIRGAFLRSLHCKIIWTAHSGYVIEKAHVKAEINVNGHQVEREGLRDGDIITLGKALSPQARLHFRLPVNSGNSAVLELPVSGAALDLLHIPSLSSARIRHVLLLREFSTIGHDPMAHVYAPDFPCCNVHLRWFEDELIAVAERGVLGKPDSEHAKVFLSTPSSLQLTRLSCIHQLRSLSSHFRDTCELHIIDSNCAPQRRSKK